MRYYDAREKADKDGKGLGIFHYTCQVDKRTYPVGLCAENCEGHPTKEEAFAHYKEGVMAELKLEEKQEKWPKVKCDIENCENEGDVIASVHDGLGPRRMHVCSDHANKEDVATLVHIGYMFGS